MGGRGSGGARGDGRFTSFGNYHEALKKSTAWFNNPENSNSREWVQNLSDEEHTALKDYTNEGGIDYGVINGNLYSNNWEDIPDKVKERIEAMDSAMDKSVLLKGMTVTRQADFKIFGAKSHQKMSIAEVRDFIQKNGDHGVLENKGYLSFGANDHGAAIDGSGLIIRVKVPPSVGAGAYVNPISAMAGAGENEFLFNRNARLKFNLKSLKMVGGKVYIEAKWVGTGKKKKK